MMTDIRSDNVNDEHRVGPAGRENLGLDLADSSLGGRAGVEPSHELAVAAMTDFVNRWR
jgi:hypothetical protein